MIAWAVNMLVKIDFSLAFNLILTKNFLMEYLEFNDEKQRFMSYSPIRENSMVKWLVDGADYMESIAEAIELAQEEIFIAGFFLSPELYLKRPVIHGNQYRLDYLLKRKAVSFS